MDKNLIITNRKTAHLREEVGRIVRQVELIKSGEVTTKTGKNRLDIIERCSRVIDACLCSLESNIDSEEVRIGRNGSVV